MANARSVVESWLDAVEGRNVEKILDLMADDVTLRSETVRAPLVGKETLRGLLEPMIGLYESIQIAREKVIATDREAAVLAHVRAKLGADLDFLGSELPTAGKTLSVDGALFFEVNEAGKITHVTRVQDLLGVMGQLGIPADRFQNVVEKLKHLVESS